MTVGSGPGIGFTTGASQGFTTNIADSCATAPAWLQYSWSSGRSPVGFATFGVFPGPASRIYQREVY